MITTAQRLNATRGQIARGALGGESGTSILEVLVASVVLGISAVGIALMFSFGNTWVEAKGDDRVALSLAQQKIEQLRTLTFNCIPVTGPGTAGQTRGPNALPCTATQVYNEPAWTTATGAAAPAPSDRAFGRLTCVQYVSDTNFSSPAYTGGSTGSPCAAGAVTNTKRITVIVTPTQQRQADDPVILQAFITSLPGGL